MTKKPFMADATAQRLAQQIQQRAPSLPPGKAHEKARSVIVGITMMVGALVCILIAGVLVVLPMFVLKNAPGLPFLVFAGAILSFGFWIGLSGAHAASGEGMEAAEAAGSGFFKGVAMIIRAARGKNGS